MDIYETSFHTSTFFFFFLRSPGGWWKFFLCVVDWRKIGCEKAKNLKIDTTNFSRSALSLTQDWEFLLTGHDNVVKTGIQKTGKVFWGVTRHVENLPDRHTEKKSPFLVFGPKRSLQIMWHGVMTYKKCENDASWSRFCVKICEMCYFRRFQSGKL